MSISGIGGGLCNVNYYNNKGSRNSNQVADSFEFAASATSQSASSENGKVLGLTTIGSKGYVAVYADSSTEENPIIKVGDYEIRIKNVDSRNATKMEMFALLSYMDDKGLTKNQGMKSFHKMTAYSMQAEYNGYFNGLSDENAAWTAKRNWIGILGNAKETFLSMPQTYEQGLNCQKLYESLKEWMDKDMGREDFFDVYRLA